MYKYTDIYTHLHNDNDAIAYVFVFMCRFDLWLEAYPDVFLDVWVFFAGLRRGYALAHARHARAEVPIALAESGT